MIGYQKKERARRFTSQAAVLARHLFRAFKKTPLHPQWHAFMGEESHLRNLSNRLHGRILEIGSGNRRLEKHLASDTRYIALDYPPSGQRYNVRPDVWGDASALPFGKETMDAVVMLEVLEHLPDPHAALHEASRVMTANGQVVLSFPFLYPIHDSPYDFSRLTHFGLKQLAADAGLEIVHLAERGGAGESAALLSSLALAQTALSSIERISIKALVALPLLLFVPFINVAGWILSRIAPVEHFMPMGYVAVLKKTV
jgi:SAM-dependent methyltransferase